MIEKNMDFICRTVSGTPREGVHDLELRDFEQIEWVCKNLI